MLCMSGLPAWGGLCCDCAVWFVCVLGMAARVGVQSQAPGESLTLYARGFPVAGWPFSSGEEKWPERREVVHSFSHPSSPHPLTQL